MSKIIFLLFSFYFALAQSNVIPARFRRQYTWGVTPYYEHGQYYETQPQQWSSHNQYQNDQNYYSPYFYGYQRQKTWQTSNQPNGNFNSYQSSYNRPPWFGNLYGNENRNRNQNTDQSGGYATAPPDYNQGSYARPKYLATMQPKPTLLPVVLERSALFVTQQPEVIRTFTSGSGSESESGSGRHPTFLERLGVATLPSVLTTSGEEAERQKALKMLESAERIHEFLPERSEDKSKAEEEVPDNEKSNESELTSTPTTPIISIENKTELSVAEKDKDNIALKEFFETSSTAEGSSTVSESPSTSTEAAETTQESTTADSTTTVTETTTTTTTTTLTTEAPSVTTTTKEVQPVTLLAFQEVTDEKMVSREVNITQSLTDQGSTSESNLNETGEGSGTGATTDGSAFVASTGIVGLRSPPLPKAVDPEKVGLEVVEWTDQDNGVRRLLRE